jgi:hypothetical protein
MDPSIASMLAVAMIGAVGIVAYEMRTSLQPPACAECPHCRARELAHEREQADLQQQYAERWRLGDRDDDDWGRRR